MTFRRALTAGVMAVFALAVGTETANATQAYTLDAAVVINAGNNTLGVVGTLNPVLDGFGNADTSGSILLSDGTVNFATQDIFVVDLTLAAGSSSVDALGITVGVVPFAAPVGGGAFDDGGGLTEPGSSETNVGFSFATIFDFSGDNVDAGETTVRLFSTYTGGMAIGQTATFMVSSGTNFTVQGTIVPEPSTALLLGAGLVSIGVVFRRKGRSV